MELFRLLGTIAIDKGKAIAGLNEVTDKAKSTSEKTATAFKTIGEKSIALGQKLAIMSAGAGVAFGAMVKSAANVKAMNSQFAQTFAGVEKEATAAMRNVASESGIMESRLKGVGTQIYAFAKTTGMETPQALGMMERALQVTADSAAYYDRSLEETSESLQSFLKGNFENDAALGLSCTETTRNAAANKLYGKSFMELSESQKQLTLLQMVEDANKLSGAMGQAARESDGWENVMGNLKESVVQLAASIGEVVLPVAVKFIQKATEFVNKFQDMGNGAKIFIVALLGITAAASPVLIVFGTVAKSIGNIIDVASKVAPTLAKVGGAFKAALISPAGIAVMAIAALIAIFVVAYQHSETFREIVQKLGSAIKEKLQGAIEALKPAFDAVITAFKSLWQTIQSELLPAFMSIYTTIVAVYENNKPIIDAIVSLFKIAFTNIKTVISTVFNVIVTVVKTQLKIISNFIKTITAIIKGDWKGAWQGIKNIFSTIMNGIKDVAKNILNGILGLFGTSLGGIKSKVVSVFNSVKNTITDKMDAAKEKVKSAIDKIKSFFNITLKFNGIKLPHIDVAWKTGGAIAKIASKLGLPGVPDFNVSWYDKGAIFSEPTIFSTPYGWKGVGERRPEAVAPIEELQNYVAAAVASQNAELVEILTAILSAIKDMGMGMLRKFEAALQELNIEFDEREIARVVRKYA